jgi:hypothetical protein
VWRPNPSVLLEMTTLRRTLQTHGTDNQELNTSKYRKRNLSIVVAADAAPFAS